MNAAEKIAAAQRERYAYLAGVMDMFAVVGFNTSRAHVYLSISIRLKPKHRDVFPMLDELKTLFGGTVLMKGSRHLAWARWRITCHAARETLVALSPWLKRIPAAELIEQAPQRLRVQRKPHAITTLTTAGIAPPPLAA